jgi:predicted nucleotidyltransferase
MSERLKQQLDIYTEVISSLEWVRQIFLFGSHAYGEPQEHSDLDLLVIVDDSLDPINATVKINQQLIGKRTIPLDVVVNRKKDFDKATKENTIQKMISDTGVLLYEAS